MAYDAGLGIVAVQLLQDKYKKGFNRLFVSLQSDSVFFLKNYLVGFFRLLMLAVVFNYTNHISLTPLSLIYNIISYLNGRFLGVMRIIST